MVVYGGPDAPTFIDDSYRALVGDSRRAVRS
jgi:hypothetical protein